MTPVERMLLSLVAQDGVYQGSAALVRAALVAAMQEWAAEPMPVTPRAKYVSIETAAERSRTVAARFKGYFCKDGKWSLGGAWAEPEAIHQRLVALGGNPDPDQAAKLLGNKSWTHLSCDGCQGEFLRLVEIGGENWERHSYCPTCISEAAALLKEAT